MGEKSVKYGVLADMEALTILLDATCKEYMILRDALSEVRQDNDKRAERNALLRDRLDSIKGEVQDQVGGLLDALGIVDAKDVLSEKEIVAHLTDAYHKFDSSGDQQLGKVIFFFL
jgi:hypothetical protein